MMRILSRNIVLCLAAVPFAVACAGAQVKPAATLVDASAEPPPPEPVGNILARGRASLDACQYDAVRRTTAEVLAREPANAEALFLAAHADDLEGAFEAAVAGYRKVLEAEAGHEGALLNLGRTLRRLERYDEAIELYVKALEADPENVKLRNNLGVCYRLAGRFDEAEKTLRRVLARAPGNVDAYKNMAILFYDQDKLALAEQFSVEARKLDDKDAGIWNNLGLIHFKKDEGRPSRALAAFKQAARLDPKDVSSRMNIGAIALRYRDYAGAEEQFGRAVQLEANNWQARLGYAHALDGARKLSEAIAEYDKVLAQRGVLPEVVFAKGLAYKGMRDWERTNETFRHYGEVCQETGAACPAERLAKMEEEIKSSDYMLSLAQKPKTPPAPVPAPAVEKPAPAPDSAAIPAGETAAIPVTSEGNAPEGDAGEGGGTVEGDEGQ